MNPKEHVWDALGRRVSGRQPPPQTIQELGKSCSGRISYCSIVHSINFMGTFCSCHWLREKPDLHLPESQTYIRTVVLYLRDFRDVIFQQDGETPHADKPVVIHIRHRVLTCCLGR
ncbi:hypothetical protein TNCV_4918191 [Trichonephila clavipes]|nr:hypothetical protein TNCV_4918191 [Trichonephila clavipes]